MIGSFSSSTKIMPLVLTLTVVRSCIARWNGRRNLCLTLKSSMIASCVMLLVSAVALGQDDQKKGKDSLSVSVQGTFRIVLNGFKVNHESDDDIFEGDGKRDEVYLRAEVFVLDRNRRVMLRRNLRSVLMGDVNNQSDPPRIRAGSASGDGGLRTNDKWPISEPWRRVTNPLSDRPPMLLWEGTLVRGDNMVVITPTVWEWDSRDPSPTEIEWDGQVDHWFIAEHSRLLSSNIAEFDDYRFALSDRDQIFRGGTNGTRPIGIDHGPNGSHLRVHSLELTYDRALQMVTSAPFNLGYGLVALNYTDAQDHGDYTLYIQVEQVTR